MEEVREHPARPLQMEEALEQLAHPLPSKSYTTAEGIRPGRCAFCRCKREIYLPCFECHTQWPLCERHVRRMANRCIFLDDNDPSTLFYTLCEKCHKQEMQSRK